MKRYYMVLSNGTPVELTEQQVVEMDIPASDLMVSEDATPWSITQQAKPRTVQLPAKREPSTEALARAAMGEASELPSIGRMLLPRSVAMGEAGRKPDEWTAFKDVESIPGRALSGLTTGLSTALFNAPELTWTDPARYANAIETGRRSMATPGEGNIAEDPMLPLALASGALPGRIAAGIKSPSLRMGANMLAGAGVGAGTGYLQAAAEPSSPQDATRMAALGAGLGAALPVAGGWLSKWGYDRFPGLGKNAIRSTTESGKDLIRENLPDFLSYRNGLKGLPWTKDALIESIQRQQIPVKRQFQKAASAVPSWWEFPTSKLDANAKAAAMERLGQKQNSLLEWDEAAQKGILPPKAVDRLDEITRSIKASQWAAKESPDALNIHDLATYKTVKTSPKTYLNTEGRPDEIYTHLGRSFHDAANDAMLTAPNYASTLAETPMGFEPLAKLRGYSPQAIELRKNPAKAFAAMKTFERNLMQPGALGLQDRFLGMALERYRRPLAAIRLGDMMQRAGNPAARDLIQGLGNYANFGQSQEPDSTEYEQ